MSIVRGTHLLRVYRQVQGKRHDLNAVRSLVDVNGEDVWGIVKPVQSEIIDIGPGSQVSRRVELWMDSELDLDIGYLVELKRTRVLEGQREVIEEALTSGAAAGSTTLHVASTVGFRKGDAVLLWDGSTSWEESRVQDFDASSLTLYADCALTGSYQTNDYVRVARMFRVVDQRIPEDVGPYRVAVLQHVAHQLAVGS